MRYGEHLEGRRNISRATAYRRKQRQVQRGYSESSSEDEISREYVQRHFPADDDSSSNSNEITSNNASQSSSSCSSSSLSSNIQPIEVVQPLQNSGSSSLQSMQLDQISSESSEISMNNENEIYGVRDDDDDSTNNSWMRDVYEESHDSFEDESEESNNIENFGDDSYSHESVPNKENYEMPFEHLTEMLRSDDLNDTVDAEVIVSKSELLLAILKYGLIYNLSQTAIADLFKMINTFFGLQILPDTRYLIDQIFCHKNNIQFHAICSHCKMYVKQFNWETRQLRCNLCNTKIQLKSPTYQDYFVILKIENEIANLFQDNKEYYKSVINNRMENQDQDEDVFRDFTDGILYKQFVRSLPVNERRNFVTAAFNSDGSPVFKSSKYSIWPIQLIINEMPFQVRTTNPIVAGLWFGKDKPNMNIFLKPFVKYMNKLANVGVKCNINNEEQLIKVYTICFCVDSVARPPMQGIVQFNEYYGCSWCMHPGVYVPTTRDGRIKYILLNELPRRRTEGETLQYMQESLNSRNPVYGVKNPTCLINLNSFSIVSEFVLDNMHSIALGMTEQFLSYWIDTSRMPYSLSNANIDKMNIILSKIKVPKQIARLSRSVTDRSWWKAREFENFALYYSVPILLSFPHMLPYAKHWAFLVEAFYILLKNGITREELNRSDFLLKRFVVYAEEYYSPHCIAYNVHQMLHMAQSVVNWGPLWCHNGYCFETGNGQLVHKIQAAKGVIHQLCRLMTMKQSELILKQYASRRPHSGIIKFISYLDNKKYQSTFKSQHARYFGPYRRTKSRFIHQLQLSHQSRTYRKILKNKCLYTSCKKRNLRSDNKICYNKR